MTEIRWRNNQVISIETKRKDESRETRVYVLAQMILKGLRTISLQSVR